MTLEVFSIKGATKGLKSSYSDFKVSAAELGISPKLKGSLYIGDLGGGASKTGDAASMAKKWQGSGAYPGVDDWSNVTIKKGTKVWGGAPGQSNFYTTEKVMKAVDSDATNLNQGLQVGRGSFPQFRPGMTQYEVTQDITVGYSKALANPQYGSGGFDQYFIPNYDNVLKPIQSIIMNNR